MATNASLVRELKIKTGALKRLVKEIAYYEKETVQQAEKAKKMAEEAETEDDKYVAKKMAECALETKQTIGVSKRKCEKYVEDLQKFLADNETSFGEESAEFIEDARKQLEAAGN